MPNIAQVLKAEMARISRKEAKSAVNPVRQSNAKARETLAELKARVAELEAQNKRILSALDKVSVEQVASPPEPDEKARITSKSVQSLRKKLGLSGEDFARLVGTTAQSVYMWERKGGPLKLRKNTLSALVSVRGLGKREAKAQVSEMKAGENKKAAAKKKK